MKDEEDPRADPDPKDPLLIWMPSILSLIPADPDFPGRNAVRLAKTIAEEAAADAAEVSRPKSAKGSGRAR